MEKLNSDYLEKIILKGMLSDRDFLVLISSTFIPDYFDDPNIRHAFEFCKNYSNSYDGLPSRDAIINSSENVDDIKVIIEQAEATDFNIAQSYTFLLDQTNDYLKEKAIKRAIIDSVDDVENPERRNIIRDRIESALIKDIKVDLGLRYFRDLQERLRRIFTASEKRIPTYFPIFDEFINGGFPALTFSVFLAKIHGGKSNIMANFAARQSYMGHNVVLLTLEMSQDAFAQRMDSIYSLLDINRIYMSTDNKRRLLRKLQEKKGSRRTLELDEDGNQTETGARGELFIKQYPTGTASVLDFRIYLRELMLREVIPDIIYVDYINLMQPSYKTRNDMYLSVKHVSEELRALSFEFKCPVVSVSQLNREGFFTQFSGTGFEHTAESMGIPQTADFMTMLGTDEERMEYENEVLYRIVKSRIGRNGIDDKFYLDRRSLKMYDSSELDVWIEDATESGDERQAIDHAELEQRRQARRRRRD